MDNAVKEMIIKMIIMTNSLKYVVITTSEKIGKSICIAMAGATKKIIFMFGSTSM